MNELKNRGVQDILIAVIDGLKGFPEAIIAVFHEIEIQTCIVHLIRNSLSFCNWKQRQSVARELKQIYEAETVELAAKRLEDFAGGPWGGAAGNRLELASGLGVSDPLFHLS